MTDANVPQPPPKPSDGPDVWDVVIRDLQDPILVEQCDYRPKILKLMAEDARQRNADGIAKYGVPLRPNNGRNNLVDLLQEIMDAVAYATADRLEQEIGGDECMRMDMVIADLFAVWYRVRSEAEWRKALAANQTRPGE